MRVPPIGMTLIIIDDQGNILNVGGSYSAAWQFMREHADVPLLVLPAECVAIPCLQNAIAFCEQQLADPALSDDVRREIKSYVAFMELAQY
jgi:hypothetical protein